MASDTHDPEGERPDAWADDPDARDVADRAYEEKWSDDVEAPAEALAAPPDPFSPSPSYTPTTATPRNVSDAYVGGMSAAGPYLGLGVQIAASMALFTGGGYAVDRWLGTSPWGILVGAVLGMVGIVALIVRVAREADAESARRKRS